MVVLLVLLAAWLGSNVAVLAAAYALDRRSGAGGPAGGPRGRAPAAPALRAR